MVLPRNPDAAREAAMSVDIGDGGGSTEAGARYIKLSPRQRTLSHLWSFFKVAEHDGKSLDWDGRPLLGPGSRDAVSRQGYIPDGYTSAEGVPRDFRRPVAQLGIVRNIISRFTGLLFSNRKQPRIAVPGDQQTEDYLSALLKQGGFFPTMTQVRNHGGAMGSGCIGFRFINGIATFEALDPRWVTPEFVGRGFTDLKKLTITYTYVKEEWDEEHQKWKNVWYWYRRVIDTETDTVWAPVKCRSKMPDWDYIQRNTVRHNLGFHPYEWIQNIKDDDEADGEPDCVGCYDAVQAIDAVLTEVYSGTTKNCVGGETSFITSEGTKKFFEFRDGAAVTVLTHTGSWKPAIVKSYGRQPLYKLRLGRGRNVQELRATAGHRWILQDGRRVTTEELKPGDKLFKPPHIIRDWSYDDASDAEKVSWARGFAFGDGGVEKNAAGKPRLTVLRLCGAKARFLPRFEQLGYEASYVPSAGEDPIIRMRDYTKALPKIGEVAYEELVAFVRGYLDADGSRNLKHPETCDINPFQGIQATGDAAVEFIRKAFPMVGAYIVAEDDRTLVETNFAKERDYTVYFSLVLGFSSSPVSSYIVRSIEEDAKDETVWCLEVQDDQSFVLPSGIVTSNCDPTLLLTTNQQLGEIKKGSDSAIRLDQGGTATYLELQGAGSRAGIEVMKELEDRVYRLAQCVPDHILYQNSGEKTATEIERIFSSMLERADSLREQYAPAMVRICQKLLTAVRTYTAVRELEDGTLVRGRIYVPPRVVQQGDGDTVEIPRSIGKGTICEVQWPEYYRPSYTDINTAIQFATSAKDATLISGQTIKRYVATLFGVDPIKEIHTMKKEEEEASLDEQAADAEGGQGGAAAGAAPADGEDPNAAPTPTDVPESASNPASWKAALDAGIITINEYREKALGLGALPDGDLTTTQYKAKYSSLFVASTAATSPQGVNMALGQDDKKEEGGKPGGANPPGKKPSGGQQPKAGTSASPKKSAQPPKRPSSAPDAKQASPEKQSPRRASGQKAKT